jgi:hypothetical protein
MIKIEIKEICALRVERTLLTRILGELYELHEFLSGINLSIVICFYKIKNRSKEIRVIRTIRLKFVLNGVQNVFSTLNSHKIAIYTEGSYFLIVLTRASVRDTRASV